MTSGITFEPQMYALRSYFVNFLLFVVPPGIPGDCPLRSKMLFSSTKDTLKKKLEGLQGEIHANDMEDLHFNKMVEKLEKK